jgi:branched-chain amino acid aminotransferase
MIEMANEKSGRKIYLDGEYVDYKDAKISIFDHGVLYGDGVFEGIRAYHGRIFKLKEHVDRLYNSAKSILLKIPLTKDEMIETVKKTVSINNLSDAYIRLVVTRGVGDLGLDPKKCPKATIFIIADKIDLYPKRYYEEGLEIITVPTRKNSREALNPKIKSLNYLNNILAKIEASHAGAVEAIMLNDAGYVTECTGDNIFIVKNKTLITPPLHVGILEGITRDYVMELARKSGFTVSEELFSRYAIFNADECFLTGTAAEIIPVVTVDTRTIGTGKPGPVTNELIEAFHESLKTLPA